MLCYSIDDESRIEIESKLRKAGSQIVSSNWPCWIQYYYQSIFPRNSNETLAQLPLFSVVSIGKQGKTFVITEIEEYVKAEGLTYPVNVCDVTAMDPELLDNISVFNLKNKRQKRISFDFHIFRKNGHDIYLADNLVIFMHAIDRDILPDFILEGEEKLGRFMRNLDVELDFKRPKTHTDDQRIAFWVYTYSKRKDGVTIPPIRPREHPVTFDECLFAKNMRLV